MSPLAIAMIVVGSTLGYMVGAGITYALGKERGWNCEHLGPLLAVTLWPLLLPAVLSATATRSLIAGRKQKQLPEAKVVER